MTYWGLTLSLQLLIAYNCSSRVRVLWNLPHLCWDVNCVWNYSCLVRQSPQQHGCLYFISVGITGHAIRFELFPVLLFWGCWVSLCSPSWQETHYAGAWDYSPALSPKLWDWKCRPLGSTLQSIDLTNKSWTCFSLRFTFWTFVSSCLGWSLRWACVQVKSQYVTELDNLDSETPTSLGQWVLGYQVPVGKLLDFTWAVEVLRPSLRWPIGLIFMYLLYEQNEL